MILSKDILHKKGIIPGSSVENQNLLLSDYINRGTSIFQTRQGLTGSFANSNPDLIKIASIIQDIAKKSPHLLDQAIEYARNEGLSASSIGNIISESLSKQEFNNLLINADYRGDDLPSLSDEELEQIDEDEEDIKQEEEADESQLKLLNEEFPESTDEYNKAVKLLNHYVTEMKEEYGFSKEHLQALIESIFIDLADAGNMNQFHLNALYEQFSPWMYPTKKKSELNTYNELVNIFKKADDRGEDLPSLSEEEIDTAVNSTVLSKPEMNTVQVLNDEFPNSDEVFEDTFKLLSLYKNTMTEEAGFSINNLNALIENILLKADENKEINSIQLQALFEEFAPWVFTEGFKFSKKPKSVQNPKTEEFIHSEYTATDPTSTTMPAHSISTLETEKPPINEFSSDLETDVPTAAPTNSHLTTKIPTTLASITDLESLKSVFKKSTAQNPFNKLYGTSTDIKDFSILQKLIEQNPTKPETVEPKQDVSEKQETKEEPKKKEKITPINNRSAWVFLYNEVKEELDKTPEEKFHKGLFTLKGQAEEAAKLREVQFNKLMNERNAVGPYELNNSGFYWIDVAGIDYKEVPETFEADHEVEDYWESYKNKHNIKIQPEDIVEIELILRDEQNELDSILSHYNIKPTKLHEVNEYVESYKKNLRKYIIDSHLEEYGYPKMFGDAQPPNKLKLAEKLERNALVGRGGGYIAGTPSVKLPEKKQKEDKMKKENVGVLSPEKLEALFPELFKSQKELITPFHDAKGWENAWETAKANAIQTLSAQYPEFTTKLKKRDKESINSFYDVVNKSMLAENWAPAYSDEGNPSKNKWYVELNKVKD
jgi:hypothetical protein